VGENTNERDEVDVKCYEERVTCFSPIHGDLTQRGVGYETWTGGLRQALGRRVIGGLKEHDCHADPLQATKERPNLFRFGLRRSGGRNFAAAATLHRTFEMALQ